MSRIEACFEELHQQGRKALITYITAGDPDPKLTVRLMHTLVSSGADLIELGVPFSDPMADGPVIQAACERALAHYVSLHDVLDMVREFRRKDTRTPIVLMGYLNPIEMMGYSEFAEAASDVGLDGLLVVDLPPEEAEMVINPIREKGVDPIYLLSPTSLDSRIDLICGQAKGFIYYVSLKGVTGSKALNVDAVAERVKTIRSRTDLPVGVGFGIRDAEMAGRVSSVADAVVVGSAVVNLIAEHSLDHELMIKTIEDLVISMRKAVDRSNAATDNPLDERVAR